MSTNTTTTDDDPYDCSYCGDPVDPDEHGDHDTLGDIFIHAQCEADRAWETREDIATTAGIFEMASITTTKTVGRSDKTIDSYWQAECPVCMRTHSSEESGEDARRDLIGTVTDCCDIEFVWPSDYIHNCDICGDSHRERHECKSVAWREPMPELDQEFTCTNCEWTANGNELSGPDGSCPECDSLSVAVAADYSEDEE